MKVLEDSATVTDGRLEDPVPLGLDQYPEVQSAASSAG